MEAARQHSANPSTSRREFWEHKARSYSLPFELQSMARSKRVMDMLAARGVETVGARILDIGCGTGAFSLPLARIAKEVVGLDISAVMLEKLMAEAARFRIRNVRVERMAWAEADPAALDFANAFDVVWTSMSPAVRGSDDLARMEQCSRRWCVYTGWGRVRENPLLAEAFRLHGLSFGPPPGAAAMHDMVTKAGRRTFLEYLDTSWEWEGSFGEAMDDLAVHLEANGAAADRKILAVLLARHQRKGVVRHITHAEEGVMAWQVG